MIAKFYILSRALEDKNLSHEEVCEIMGSLFDEANPTAQVNVADYLYLKQTIAHYQLAATKDKSWEIQYEDKPDAQKVSYLLKNFPGNLEHYRSVLAKNGLLDLSIFDTLPEVEINYFGQDSNQKALFSVDFNLDGVNYVFDIDMRRAINDQSFLKEDPMNGVVFADAMTALADLYQTSSLSDTETEQFSNLMTYLSPYPNPAMDLTNMLQQLSLLPGPQTNYLVTPPSVQRGQKVESSFQIPLRADSSIQTLKITQILVQVREIVGDEILNVLQENGIQIGFFDLKEILSERQARDLLRDHSSLDLVAIGMGFYEHGNKAILIGTNYPVNAMVQATVHEIGHALNFLTQDKSNVSSSFFEGNENINSPDSVVGYEITGAQRDLFFSMASQKDRWFNFPSAYGSSNQAEWFAEIFTHYMLERAGRSDLLKERIDYNPQSLKSLFVVDPIAYLMVDKIVETVEQRGKDQKSFSDLMEHGINWNLIIGIENYYFDRARTVPGQNPQQSVFDEKTRNPGEPSPTLNSFTGDWRAKPLSQIYKTQLPQKVTSLEKVLQDDFRYFTSVYTRKNPYLPGKDGNYEMKELVGRIIDARAIQIACEIKWVAKTRDDKIQVLLKNGIVNQDALDSFCDQLTILDPDEVRDLLNPDDLISEVELAYRQSVGEY